MFLSCGKGPPVGSTKSTWEFSNLRNLHLPASSLLTRTCDYLWPNVSDWTGPSSPTSTYRKTWLGGITLTINILPRTHSVTYTDFGMLRPCKAIPAHRTGMLCLECARAHQNMGDSITEEGHTWTQEYTGSPTSDWSGLDFPLTGFSFHFPNSRGFLWHINSFVLFCF